MIDLAAPSGGQSRRGRQARPLPAARGQGRPGMRGLPGRGDSGLLPPSPPPLAPRVALGRPDLITLLLGSPAAPCGSLGEVRSIKNWQKEAFHKQMMGSFKETKEAEDGFRKAQKPWAKKLKEVHPSCRLLPRPPAAAPVLQLAALPPVLPTSSPPSHAPGNSCGLL